jgi:hypothetical protein
MTEQAFIYALRECFTLIVALPTKLIIGQQNNVQTHYTEFQKVVKKYVNYKYKFINNLQKSAFLIL